LGKLAKIIRKRTGAKNAVFTSDAKRVNKNLALEDCLTFIKSKRLWRALKTEKSSVLHLEGVPKG